MAERRAATVVAPAGARRVGGVDRLQRANEPREIPGEAIGIAATRRGVLALEPSAYRP
jgi:hypothetical protein